MLDSFSTIDSGYQYQLGPGTRLAPLVASIPISELYSLKGKSLGNGLGVTAFRFSRA